MYILLVSLSAILAVSCGDDDRRLREALILAGDNRAELEKVLEHYSRDESDSLKLRAAKFIIANMPGHVSYIPEKISGFRSDYERIALDPRLSVNQKKEQLESMLHNSYLDLYTIQDVELISAGYLIADIDRSFAIWDSVAYCRHLSFDEFCELILPYKCAEYQELDNWKAELASVDKEMIGAFPNDENYDNPQTAAKGLTLNLRYLNGVNHVHDYNGAILYNKKTLADVKFGRCEDYSLSAVAIMRSKGIPACFEGTPRWPQKPTGHAWHTILNDNGAYLPSPWNLESFPGDVFFPDKKISKVLRNTYATNPFFEEYGKKSLLKLPLFHKFQKDVTDLYIETSDLAIPLTSKNIKEKYAYLAMFDNTDWNVIGLGVVKGRKARFSNVGRGIVYIVMGYNGEELLPVSMPFILESSGDVRYCDPQPEASGPVKLTRKFPKSAATATTEYHFTDAQLEASNQRDFSNADTLYVIEDMNYPDLIQVDTSKHYRYWRYRQTAPKKYCSLSEFQFYRPGSPSRPASGEIITDEREAGRHSILAKAFDGNWLTDYTSQAWGDCWIGLDFGEPVSIAGIRVVARSDDNGIHYGDKYELKYWDGGWVSLGEQTARERYLIYNDIPKDALLLLSNNTRGDEERVFTLENGKVRWW